MNVLRKFCKRALMAFMVMGAFLGVCSMNAEPVQAAWDTGQFDLRWYNNGEWLEGWSGWTYPPSADWSKDWVWLRKVNVFDDGTVSYETRVGLNNSGNPNLCWKWPYEISVSDGQKVNIGVGYKYMNAIGTGEVVQYNAGAQIHLKQGQAYTIRFYVHNGKNETVSVGSISITVPIYKIPEHNVAFDTQGGTIDTFSDSDKGNYYLPDSGFYHIKANEATTYIHTVGAGTGEYTQTVLYHTKGEKQAQWYLERYNNTQYYTIQHNKSNKYLSGGNSGSTADMQPAMIKTQKTMPGNIITTNISTGGISDNQLWFFTKNKDGSVIIHNKQDPNQVLDALGYHYTDENPVGFYHQNAAGNQNWVLEPITTGQYATKTKRMNQYQFIPTTVPVKVGYQFQNWNTKADGTGTRYAAGQNYTHDQDGGTVTLYAQWKPITYDVTYNGNGATSGSMAKDTVQYQSNYTIKENAFQKTGYEFVGWNTKADGSGKDYSPGNTFKWTAQSDLTLYAQWKPITYIVRFHGNGATSGTMTDQTLTYDKKETLKPNAFKKKKADFIEWNTKADGSGTSYKDKASVLNLTTQKGKVIDLYAIWDNEPILTVIDNAYERGETIKIEDLIKDTAKADDEEDGKLDDEIKVIEIKYPDGTTVKNPDPDDLLDTDFDNMLEIEITFEVEDSYGHKVKDTGTVTIIDPYIPNIKPPVETDNNAPVYNRYIDKEYEDTLEGDSIWATDPEYADALQKALDKLQ